MVRIRKYLFIFFALVLLCLSGIASIEVVAKKGASRAWASAYLKVVKKCNKESRQKGGTSPYRYKLIYFDKDKTPELIVTNYYTWASMYTYDKKAKKAIQVMDHWSWGMGSGPQIYYPQKNMMCQEFSLNAGSTYVYKIYKLKKGKLVPKYSKDLNIRNYLDMNKNGIQDTGEKYTPKSRYYFGNSIISKKKFKRYTSRGKGKSINLGVSYSKIRKQLSDKS